MVIAEIKPLEEIKDFVKGFKKILNTGCGGCTSVCLAGGQKEVDTLNTGAARIWEWVTQNMTAPLDATSTNVRQGIADAFGAQTTTRANLLGIGKEACSVFESIYATGTGTDASPGVRTIVGNVSVVDLSTALNQNPCA